MLHGRNQNAWGIGASLTAHLMTAFGGQQVRPQDLMPDEYRPPVQALPPSQWFK
jgi:hypothetical protein